MSSPARGENDAMSEKTGEISAIINVNKSATNKSEFISHADEGPIKIIGPNDEEIFPEDIIVGPDGGWGWVVVFAAFMSNLIVDGIVYAYGILMAAILKQDHEASPTKLGWVGGILTGFYLSTGPFVSAIANTFGFRITAITGSLVASFGFLMVWVFNTNSKENGANMNSLFVFYGFIGGIGLCLLYVPSLLTVGFYFEKRRALATGITVCGSGCGTFVIAPLVAYLVDKIGWSYTILVEASLIFSMTFFAILYRPLKPVKHKKINGDGNISIVSQTIMLAQPGEGSQVIVKVKSSGMGDFEAGRSLVNGYSSRNAVAFSRGQGQASPVQKNVIVDNPENQDENEKETTKIYENIQKKVSGLTMDSGVAEGTIMQKTVQASVDSVSVNADHGIREHDHTSTQHHRNNHHSHHSRIGANGTKSVKTITLVVDPSSGGYSESRVYRVASKHTLNRPLYRSNIFYSGDLDNISEHLKNDGNYEWKAVPVIEGAEAKRKKECKCDCSVMKKLLDFSLMKSLSFVLLAISGGFTFLAFYVPFMYLPGICMANKADESKATFLIAVIGIANTLGRILCGFLADRLITKVLLINNIALSIAGVTTLLVPFIKTYEIFILYSFVFGLCCACFISLRPILLVELVGLSRLTNGMGIVLLFQGVGAFVGTPIAASLKELNGNFNLSFHVAGGLMLISGVLCYPLHITNHWEKTRLQNLQTPTQISSNAQA